MKPQNLAYRFDARCPRSLLLALLVGAALAAPADAGSTKFIPTFLVYYGGGPTLTAADAPKLAKFDLIDIDRFRYNQIGGGTWNAIKAYNPDVQIYLYQIGPEAQNYMDAMQVVSLNGLGRYNVSRGLAMGSLNGNNPGLFLQDAGGQRIYSKAYSNVSQGTYWHLMDFGDTAYQQYWLSGTKSDIVDQPWAADGVFADNCLSVSAAGGYSANSVKYPTNAAWSTAMNQFTNAISSGLHSYGQKLWCNKGDTVSAEGTAAWLELDNSASPPDVLLEEGAFAVKWGNGATQFFPEANWKRQVDVMGAMQNSKIAMLAHTDLYEGQSGTDNWGRPVSFGQTLWYALGSFLLGKNDERGNAYFTFVDGDDYNRILWFEEYDRLDLGRALGAYRVTSIGGVNVYWREFERGYVYVNPTASDVASVALPQAVRLLTRSTLATLVDLLPLVNTIPLAGHHAAFVLKTGETPAADTQAPTVPTGFTATAVSGTQVNLAWNASTDNVGVSGYTVYLNDQPLTNTTARTFSHTGLTAGNTYNYRVSAFDAVPNQSAWTAAVSATPTLADTQAPSVPTGFAASVSGTQVNLSWNASADNVGVTGYYVYLNDAPLAVISSTSYSHIGLATGTTYNYRVSAFDAVPNHSAWTAAVSVTTTLADTQAPTVPTGFTATAVSGTQVNLAWNASTDNVGVTGYYVYLNDQPLTTTTARTFSHTGLTAGNTYNYRVSAFDAVPNHSAWTAAVSATPTLADTQAPTVPAGLTATAVSGTQVNLSWNAATDNVGVTGYTVYLNDAPLTTTTARTFSHTGLTAGNTYNYRVSAFDAVPNHSAWTAAVSATPTLADTQAPTVPAGLTATVVSGTQVTLAWNAATDNVGVTGYTVYLNDQPLATTTAPTFSHTGLTEGNTYNYRVSAFDAVPNHSAWTSVVQARTGDTIAPAVSITSPLAEARLQGMVSITASATDNVGVVGVQFQYNGINLGAEDTSAPYAVSAHTKSVPNGTFTLTAIARDAAGNRTTSAPITVSVRN